MSANTIPFGAKPLVQPTTIPLGTASPHQGAIDFINSGTAPGFQGSAPSPRFSSNLSSTPLGVAGNFAIGAGKGLLGTVANIGKANAQNMSNQGDLLGIKTPDASTITGPQTSNTAQRFGYTSWRRNKNSYKNSRRSRNESS